jgi:hypothetical protein
VLLECHSAHPHTAMQSSCWLAVCQALSGRTAAGNRLSSSCMVFWVDAALRTTSTLQTQLSQASNNQLCSSACTCPYWHAPGYAQQNTLLLTVNGVQKPFYPLLLQGLARRCRDLAESASLLNQSTASSLVLGTSYHERAQAVTPYDTVTCYFLNVVSVLRLHSPACLPH